MTLSNSEQLMYSTVRIECTLTNDDISTGTGFIFAFQEGSKYVVPVIVTNKHVVKGAKQGCFHFNRANEDGFPKKEEYLTIEFNQFEKQWIFHPDPKVDLCIILLAPIINRVDAAGEKIFIVPLSSALIPSEEKITKLTAIEEIIMIGYPNGIWDSVNNLPIFRKGITATHPSFDYNGKEEFLIDAACFPGSSGSPVLIFNTGGYQDKKGNIYVGPRTILLGVLYAGPQHTATGEIQIVEVPTKQQPVAFSRIPNNLGVVIKSKRILEFQPIIKQLLQQKK